MKVSFSLIFLLVSSVFSQSELEEYSSFKSEPYSDEWIKNGTKQSITNVRFKIPLGWGTDFVIKETMKIEKVQGQEFTSSSTNLIAHSFANNYEVLWEINDSSDEVFYHWMDFIETIKYGCCGATNNKTIYDLKTGKRILNSDSDITIVKNLYDKTDRFFGFNSYASVQQPFNPFNDETITAQFFYSTRKSQVNDILIIFPEIDVYAWPPDSIYFMDKKGNEYFPKQDNNKMMSINWDSEFNETYVVVDYNYLDRIMFFIENGRINIEKSKIPPEIIVDDQNDIFSPEYLNTPSFNKLILKSKSELRIIRNEIFARHGQSFKSEDLQKYFKSKDWYNEKSNYQVNIETLENDEKLILRKIQYLEKNVIN